MSDPFRLSGKRLWVAGHQGLVGASLVRLLSRKNCQLLTAPKSRLDLRDATATKKWVKEHKPDAILLAAAKVGGIAANDENPVEFLNDNLSIQQSVLSAAHEGATEKLVFLGSSCIYPKHAEQPIKEEALLSGCLEPTNEAYALAKIAGIKSCQFYRRQYGCNFISLMPCNLYGPGDRWNSRNSHVIPALISRFHQAKNERSDHVALWGSGQALREFLYVDDLSAGILHALEHYSEAKPLNIGSDEEVSIAALAKLIADVVGYSGKIEFDHSMPDGTPRKLLDNSRITDLGWAPHVKLRDGLKYAYQDFLQSMNRL